MWPNRHSGPVRAITRDQRWSVGDVTLNGSLRADAAKTRLRRSCRSTSRISTCPTNAPGQEQGRGDGVGLLADRGGAPAAAAAGWTAPQARCSWPTASLRGSCRASMSARSPAGPGCPTAAPRSCSATPPTGGRSTSCPGSFASATLAWQQVPGQGAGPHVGQPCGAAGRRRRCRMREATFVLRNAGQDEGAWIVCGPGRGARSYRPRRACSRTRRTSPSILAVSRTGATLLFCLCSHWSGTTRMP